MRNQILSVDNTVKTKKKSVSGPIEIKKILIFFAIITIIFSLSCVGIGTYAIFDNNGIIGYKKPQIETEKVDDKLLITVTATNPIDRIEYEWNSDGDKVELQENSSLEIEEEIDLPVGNNTLKIVTYDINGKTTTYEETYEVESLAPQLSIEAVNSKIKVTAKDNEKMLYITYRWDEDQETRIDATEESSAQIQQEIEIPKGRHTLTIVAVNSRNLTTEKTQEVKGVRKPVITAVQDADDMRYVILGVSDDEAVKNVIFEINGKKYQINLSNYHEQSIQYRIELQEGENLLIVTATNFDEAESTFEGKCTYNP